MPETYSTEPYNDDFDPVLYEGGAVSLAPGFDTYTVEQLEIIPTIETQEVTVPANNTLPQVEMTNLYAQDTVLAQLRLVPGPSGTTVPSDIAYTVDQGGAESPRYNLKNVRGRIDEATADIGDNFKQTELFQFEDEDLFFNFENTSGSDTTFTLTFSGFAFDLIPSDIEPAATDVTVPVERLNLR